MSNNYKLPSGDFVRQLIGQPSIKPSDVRSIIRGRGVFTSDDDKKNSAPILIKTGLSPAEYQELKEAHKAKEESPKSKTRTVKWASERTLIEALPKQTAYSDLMSEPFALCEFVGQPRFSAKEGNPDHAVMDFEIARKDLMKNFGENVTNHRGQIELKKDGKELNLTISLSHTSKETKDFCDKVASHAITHFKKNSDINPESDVLSILYGGFNNEDRVKFMFALSQAPGENVLKFVDTCDIHLSPDIDATEEAEDLSWMKDKIDSLKLKGTGLHSTFFVEQADYHKFLKLYSLVCRYEFQGQSYKADCKVLFEFPKKSIDPNLSELTVDIDWLKFQYKDIKISIEQAKKEILKHIEQHKIPVYEKHKTYSSHQSVDS